MDRMDKEEDAAFQYRPLFALLEGWDHPEKLVLDVRVSWASLHRGPTTPLQVQVIPASPAAVPRPGAADMRGKQTRGKEARHPAL